MENFGVSALSQIDKNNIDQLKELVDEIERLQSELNNEE